MINFISQTYNSLTFGAKLYIVFQVAYLVGALFFTYVQVQILRELKKINNGNRDFCEKTRD